MVSPSRCPPWQPERPGPTRREPRRAQRSYTTRRDTIGAATEHRSFTQTTGWPTSERSEALPCQLQLQGTELEQVPSGGRQGRVASWRAVSPCRVHRHQPLPACRAGDRLLQSARHGGAVHQGRQERDQLDPAFLPWLPQQRGASSAARLGIQLGQLPAHARTPDGVGHWSHHLTREGKNGSTGAGFPALASATTRCVFSCTPWHTTWATSCARSPCPTEWATGR